MRHSQLVAILKQFSELNVVEPVITPIRHVKIMDFDFASLPDELWNYLPLIKWENINFINCRGMLGRQFDYCTLNNSTFDTEQDDVKFNHCLILADESSVVDSFKGVYLEAESKGSLLVEQQHRQLIVAAIMVPSHGDYYAYLLIKHLKCRGVSVVGIYCDDDDEPFLERLNKPKHPIFSNLPLIDGLYLTGGIDLVTNPSAYSKRERMEKYFVDLSLEHELPLLGVCRGHQFVAHYFGATIKNMYEPYDFNLDIHREGNKIKVLPNHSRLFAIAEHKYRTQLEKRKPSSLTKTSNGYEYAGSCMHYQGAFFKSLPKPGVMITAEAKDHLVESLQVNDHIVTYQHHHEEDHKKERFSRAVLKDFAKMVEAYSAKKVEQGVEGAVSISLGKRKKRKRKRARSQMG